MELLHTTLVEDGQIGLPGQILEQLGVPIGGEVEVLRENGKLVIAPAHFITDELWGSIKLNASEIDEVMDLEEWTV